MWLPDHVITMYVFDHSFDYHTFQMAVPPCFHIDMVRGFDADWAGSPTCGHDLINYFFANSSPREHF